MSLKSASRTLYWDYVTHGRRFTHRGLWAMALYRYGQWVDTLRPSPLKSILNKAYGVTAFVMPTLSGVVLDKATRVGRQLHIVHPGMVLIHPHTVIGERVGLMHGVTLGTNPTRPGCPRLGDDVFVGAYATVLGGITVGDKARIAANSLVLCDVPPGATAIGVPAKIFAARPATPATGVGVDMAIRPLRKSA